MRIQRGPGCWLVVGVAAPGAAATTIGNVIFIRADAMADAHLRRHEMEHVRQWREHGVLGFLVRYVGPYLRWRGRGYPHWAAYRRIPFEIEAEWIARRTSPG